MEMIATDILPFAVVEGAGFKRVMAKAEPRYQLKTAKFFCIKMMDEIYTRVVNKIKKLLSVENAGNSISFTTDCWSGLTEALMSLTAHFIDKNWKKETCLEREILVTVPHRTVHWRDISYHA